ncbi:Guanine nucleotide-binding protein subunit beta [Camellia lanceoleosa]|uniref:Guanine nucleotide-binding protein subunit beta n=1 Tax=Camellia lanceoleosa TaxID=1840588 RepID=A0ACC0HFB5_9ERIC|nr:Guanine nucleotide-binding protein subunit beta [Camellia lanceoleosa]
MAATETVNDLRELLKQKRLHLLDTNVLRRRERQRVLLRCCSGGGKVWNSIEKEKEEGNGKFVKMLEKLIGISAFMLIGACHPGATVGAVEKEFCSEVCSLITELASAAAAEKRIAILHMKFYATHGFRLMVLLRTSLWIQQFQVA